MMITNWMHYFIVLLIVFVLHMFLHYSYKLWRIRYYYRIIKHKILLSMCIKKYTYNYLGIDVVHVFPFTNKVVGLYGKLYSTNKIIVNTFPEAQQLFYHELELYYQEKLPWQIKNKVNKEMRT
jgi:hypothetical protein